MKSILIAALLAAPAQKAPPPCLTPSQIEDMALFALPPLLEAAAAACAPALPADAYLPNGGLALARTLAADSAGHWAGASAAMATMANDKFPPGLTETTARGLVRDLAAGGLASKEAQAQCGRINRVADLLAPLPPRNLAGLAVLVVEIATDGEGKAKPGTKTSKGPVLCPANQP